MISNTHWWMVAILFLLLISAKASAQDTLWRNYMEAGARAYKEGRNAKAEKSLKAAVKVAEEGFGPEDQRMFLSLKALVRLYRDQGRYDEAEPLAERSVMIVEKLMGKDHPLVATSLNNLAALYDNQGKYSEAEPLYKRSLAIKEKALGPEHFSVATSLNNLAARAPQCSH